jgi:transposase
LGDPGVDGRTILKLIFKKCDGGMDWIDLVQDRKRWRAVVNAAMNFQVP